MNNDFSVHGLLYPCNATGLLVMFVGNAELIGRGVPVSINEAEIADLALARHAPWRREFHLAHFYQATQMAGIEPGPPQTPPANQTGIIWPSY